MKRLVVRSILWPFPQPDGSTAFDGKIEAYARVGGSSERLETTTTTTLDRVIVTQGVYEAIKQDPGCTIEQEEEYFETGAEPAGLSVE